MWGLKKIREFAFIHFSLGTQRERYRSWVNAFTFKTSINMEIPQTSCYVFKIRSFQTSATRAATELK